MKKLLCVLMFGMMFGETIVQSRSYAFGVSNQDNIDLVELTGYSLDWYRIEILTVENGGYWQYFSIYDELSRSAMVRQSGYTEGGAASNLGGMWVGSLNGLGGGKGYWFLSQIEGCFNYTCSE